MTDKLPAPLNSFPDLPDTFEPERSDVESRAQEHVYKRYLQASRHWRGKKATAVNVMLFLLFALIPAIPGGAIITNVPLISSLLLFGIVAFTSIAAALTCEYLGPESAVYRLTTTLESGAWCGANTALIAISGTSSSIYWICLCGLVVVTATTVHRHEVLRTVLGLSLGMLIAYFIWQQAWSDALVSFAFGASLLWFQRLSTVTGWNAERERARAEIVSQHASQMLMEQEQARIARDLHDGVAAELTSVLWQAQGLDPNNDAEIEELVHGVRTCIAEVRAAVNQARPDTRTASQLVFECERFAKTLVGTKAMLSFGSELVDPDFDLAAEQSNHILRIIQECVRNALQHGSPDSIAIQIRLDTPDNNAENDYQLSLLIQDDGVGISLPIPKQLGGVANIRERVRMLQGKVTWSASPGGGTDVVVSLPIDIQR